MSVVLVNMREASLTKNHTLEVTDENKERMLDLSSYLEIAKKTIGHFAAPSVARRMLRDEDAISFVAEHLMRGSIRWKPDGGRTLRSYLNQRALWAIQRWILNNKSGKDNTVSLDTEIDDNGNSLYNLVANKKIEKPFEKVNIEEIINKDYLNDTQKQCLRMYFVDNMTYRAIGEALNKSGSRIEQIVSKAISKLRNELQEI